MKKNFELILFIVALFLSNISFPLAYAKNDQPGVEKKPEKKSDFLAYPHLTQEMMEKISPYLISKNHPMKARLDKIFSTIRVTRNINIFLRSGFKILEQGPRSYVVVAKHQNLPGHLVKCYFDDEIREKWGKPSWYWLSKRCEGAKKIREIIKKYKIRHFSVPKKYIYLLPLLRKTEPIDPCYIRHPALLLVTDMNLVSEKENLHAWKHFVNKEILKELYIIITLAKGASYRADNIAYSRSGKFCFIDSEYPSRGPEYDRISKYLSDPMKEYWNSLVERGGELRNQNASM